MGVSALFLANSAPSYRPAADLSVLLGRLSHASLCKPAHRGTGLHRDPFRTGLLTLVVTLSTSCLYDGAPNYRFQKIARRVLSQAAALVRQVHQSGSASVRLLR